MILLLVLSLKSSVVRHFDKIRDFIQRYFVIVYPPRSFSQATLDPVLPNSCRQVDLAFRGSGSQYGCHDDFFADGKFVFYDVARRVRRVQHPKGSYQGYGIFQSFFHVSFQQRIYLRANRTYTTLTSVDTRQAKRLS